MNATSKQFRNGNNNQGFTLVELITVIVILGILAVTIAPKLVNFSSDAHEKSIRSMGGAIKSASASVFAKSLFQNEQLKSSSRVDLDGNGTTDINTKYGYPSNARTNGIVKAMDGNFVNEWAWSTQNAPSRVVITSATLSASGAGEKVNGAPIVTGNCYLTYIAPNSAGALPTVEYELSGC